MPRTSPLVTTACLAVVILATFLSFLPALDNEFVYWDDENNLMFNKHIRSFSAENIEWMWTSSLLSVWQPLTWIITAAEFQLFEGSDPVRFSRGMHAASILLHAVAAVLVFFVVRRLILLAAPALAGSSGVGLTLGAAWAAMLFAVHPLRVEIVAWASGQPYILALIPVLGAILCYLWAQQTGRKRWHCAALCCLAASLLCKSIAVPLVLVLLVLDVYPLRRFGGAAGWNKRVLFRVIIEKVPYGALILAAIVVAIWATWTERSYRTDLLSTKMLVASFCMMFYVCMTFIPYRLSPYYLKPSPFDASDPWFVGAALLFIAITVTCLLIRRRRPWLLATWATYVFVLLPVVGLIKHGGQMAADRYSTFSCIGWAALLGAAMLRVWVVEKTNTRTVQPAQADKPPAAPNLRRVAALVVAAAAVVGLGTMTRSYCRDWRNSVTTWSAMVERNPRFWMGFYNLAKAHKRPCRDLLKQATQAVRDGDTEAAQELRREASERYEAAERDYRKAIEIRPRYPEANVDLGNMISAGQAPGGRDAAMQHYETALKGRRNFHMAHMNLASLLTDKGRFEEAIRHLELAEADAQRVGEHKRLLRIRSEMKRAQRGLAGRQPR